MYEEEGSKDWKEEEEEEKTLPMSGCLPRESKIDAPEKKGSIGSDTADTNRGFVQTNFANQLFADASSKCC